MRVPRIYVPDARPGAIAVVPPDEARHLVTVLRRRSGDRVIVFDGERSYRGVLMDVAPDVRVSIGEEVDPRPIVPWVVGVSLVKGSGMDDVVRQVSELGLEALLPLVSERSTIPVSSGRPERWRRIAVEAAKQCGRATPLRIEEPAPLLDLVEARDGSRVAFVCHPGGRAFAPGDVVGPDGLRPALFLVGPEGGFSDREIEALAQRGVRPVRFDGPILRTPTAVVLVAAVGRFLAGVGEGPMGWGGDPEARGRPGESG